MGLLRWQQADRAMRRGLPFPRRPTPAYLALRLVVVGVIAGCGWSSPRWSSVEPLNAGGRATGARDTAGADDAEPEPSDIGTAFVRQRRVADDRGICTAVEGLPADPCPVRCNGSGVYLPDRLATPTNIAGGAVVPRPRVRARRGVYIVGIAVLVLIAVTSVAELLLTAIICSAGDSAGDRSGDGQGRLMQAVHVGGGRRGHQHVDRYTLFSGGDRE